MMNYNEMFDRNIGIFSEEEQRKIHNFCIGIVGCGGMGGISAIIAARTGIESMVLADPEKFEAVNINNQFGAFEKTIGENKAKVTARMVSAINPNSNLIIYDEGVSETNVVNIIKSSDIILDCIDYNELYYTYIIANEARKAGKFVLGPQAVGYGASVLVFDPYGLSFNEYLNLREGMTKEEVDKVIIPPGKYAPIIPKYIDDKVIEDTVKKRIPIPNIALAQTLASSIMISEALFILLGKRKPRVVPEVIALDLLQEKFIYGKQT